MSAASPINVTCECGWSGRAHPRQAGKRVRCKDCEQVIRVPEAAFRSPAASRETPKRRSKARRPVKPTRTGNQPSRRRSTHQSVAAPPVRRPRRKKQKAGPRFKWLIPALVVLAFGGAVGGIMLVAGPVLRDLVFPEPPVFAVEAADVSVELDATLEMPSGVETVSMGGTYNYDVRQSNGERIVTVNRTKNSMSKRFSLSRTILVCTRDEATLEQSLSEKQTFTAATANPAMKGMMQLLGVPLYRIPVSKEGMGEPELLLSGSGISLSDAETLQRTTAFIQAPFATNLESWRALRIYSFAAGATVSGKVLYTRRATVGDDVTVDVEGTLERRSSLEINGLKVSRLLMKVSGTQVYSSSLNQWTSGQLSIEATAWGTAASEKISFPITLNFTARPID